MPALRSGHLPGHRRECLSQSDGGELLWSSSDDQGGDALHAGKAQWTHRGDFQRRGQVRRAVTLWLLRHQVCFARLFRSIARRRRQKWIRVTLVCPGYIRTDISLSALNGDGSKHAKMDPDLARGMPVDRCAAKILKGVGREKKEMWWRPRVRRSWSISSDFFREY